MTMRHRMSIRPVRLRERSHVLGCDLLRGVGFRAECSCGWRGHVLDSIAKARWERNDHVAELMDGVTSAPPVD